MENNWNYKELPEEGKDVVCWCTGDGSNYHKRVMCVNNNGSWSENYEVKCWIEVEDPE